MNVAQHRIGRRHAARGRVGQHHDIGQLRRFQLLQGQRRARHLHQRQSAFLHARAARRRETDHRAFAPDRIARGGDEGFARRRAKAAAHEGEILHQHDAGDALHLAVADGHHVLGAGLGARGLEALGIGFAVGELQRILGHVRRVERFPLAVVEGVFEPLRRADTHMIARRRDPERGVEVRTVDHLAGVGALDPEVFRRLAA